jgi:hypothetical protein
VTTGFDEDALQASLDLVGRSGAKNIEFGWLEDDVPVEEADWYAHAQYRGARISVEHYRGPVEAVEALARRCLKGAMCRRCGRPIRLTSDGMGCRWTRMGPKWLPGCGKPIDQTLPTAPR